VSLRHRFLLTDRLMWAIKSLTVMCQSHRRLPARHHHQHHQHKAHQSISDSVPLQTHLVVTFSLRNPSACDVSHHTSRPTK